MKTKARERGVITKDTEEYLPFIKTSIKNMIDAGCKFPLIKKATSPTSKIQITANLRIFDALQGYWERNRKVYTHRAKSDYRALYIGTICMLEEEVLLTGIDNSKEINELETFLKEKEHRHLAIRNISALRSEIKVCIQERVANEITEVDFEDQMDELIDKYATIVGREKSEKTINDIILEEENLASGRGRTKTWRDRKKNSLGLSVL